MTTQQIREPVAIHTKLNNALDALLDDLPDWAPSRLLFNAEAREQITKWFGAALLFFALCNATVFQGVCWMVVDMGGSLSRAIMLYDTEDAMALGVLLPFPVYFAFLVVGRDYFKCSIRKLAQRLAIGEYNRLSTVPFVVEEFDDDRNTYFGKRAYSWKNPVAKDESGKCRTDGTSCLDNCTYYVMRLEESSSIPVCDEDLTYAGYCCCFVFVTCIALLPLPWWVQTLAPAVLVGGFQLLRLRHYVAEWSDKMRSVELELRQYVIGHGVVFDEPEPKAEPQPKVEPLASAVFVAQSTVPYSATFQFVGGQL